MNDQSKKRELIKAYLLTLLKELKTSKTKKRKPSPDDTPERQVAKLMRDFKPGGKIN